MAQEQPALSLPGNVLGEARGERSLATRIPVGMGRFVVKQPLGTVGLFFIALTFFAAIFAPFVSRYDPQDEFFTANPAFRPDLYEQSLTDPLIRLQYARNPEFFIKGEIRQQLEKPSRDHWFGTDNHANDTWSRVIYGSQLSMLVGVGAACIAVFFGAVLGITSGYFGGKTDMIIQRVTDAMFTFPPLILLLLVVQVVENPNKYYITVALGVVGVAQVVRIVRSSVLSTREEVYILAARTIGASDSRIMVRHIFPNIVAPMIVIFTISIGLYILAEAGLAFIGLGDPVAISWGKMVNDGRAFGTSSPWLALFAGLAITFTVLGFNIFGDALRDVLDPRLRGRGGRPGF